MRNLPIALSLLATALPAGASQPSPLRPVSTYSIVARDPVTGDFGVAVQSHWFSVGPLVPWAQAGVGAVATQSFVDVRYGPEGLRLMAEGATAEEALRELMAADESPQVRQVAMVDGEGRVAIHTGKRCIQAAGHRLGEGYSVQANLMDKDTVPAAMARAFEAAEGDLATRMIEALAAAQAEGGDIRGKQSAAILVVRGESTGPAWSDVLVDLRIEDHPDPIAELRRLHQIHRGYAHMNAGDVAVEEGDLEAAEREYAAAEALLPGNLEARYWHAVALANAGEVDRAVEIFGEVFEKGDNWRRLTPRLADVGLLPSDPEILDHILEAAN